MTDPTPLTDTLTETATDAPPVENPVDSTPPAPLTDDDWATITTALRSWHRSPDSRLHQTSLAIAHRIEAGAR